MTGWRGRWARSTIFGQPDRVTLHLWFDRRRDPLLARLAFGIRLELLRDGEVVESQRLGKADLPLDSEYARMYRHPAPGLPPAADSDALDLVSRLEWDVSVPWKTALPTADAAKHWAFSIRGDAEMALRD